MEDNPLWYKDAIIYEVHIKSFFDSNEDGKGDFKGLTEKLDYLESLGVTAIWLLPFYISPLKDDGYDIADYFSVHEHYGTMKDFRKFLREAHQRGIRVITELVLNHTSDQHPWFQRSRRAKAGTAWRDFYVWSDTAEKYQDARIIFKDFETSNWTWDPVAKAYYWHRFYSHQPDLNFHSPLVQKAVLRIIDFWMEMGVDGMRLDAVPYLYEKEGTNCENLPETYEFLKKLRKYIDKNYKNRMLLAEANQWPEDASAYFGQGDVCHMVYHFPLMPRMFMALRMEDRFPIIDILEQTPKIPANTQWALFLRNHDELTLEMVTDEERDYMYKFFARDKIARINLGIRRRLAPLLGNSRRKVEIMNFLLFSLPGTPILYYGDEIGMGDNYYLGDRNGVRTPMQWTGDRNAGFSKSSPQKLYLPVVIDPEYNYEAVNVETQEQNLSSLLWWTRRVIAMRKKFKAFGRGDITFLFPENKKILAFIRNYEDEYILVVVNLSRFSQATYLDLSAFEGYIPVEVFSGNRFPVITKAPYILTMGFHDYFWFLLKKETPLVGYQKPGEMAEMEVLESWEQIFRGKLRKKLEGEVLPAYLKIQRWFGGKSHIIQRILIKETIPFLLPKSNVYFLILEVQYTDAETETYSLPLVFSEDNDLERELMQQYPASVLLKISVGEKRGIVFEAVHYEPFRRAMFSMIVQKKSVRDKDGYIYGYPGKFFKGIKKNGTVPEISSEVLKVEQSNTSILYGNRFFLKLYRRLEEGMNPDLEISEFLTGKAFSYIPQSVGGLEFKKGPVHMVLGILLEYVPNEGDAWRYTLDSIGRYFERALSKKDSVHEIATGLSYNFEEMIQNKLPVTMEDLIGDVYLEMTALLGRRTAEMHLALSSETENPDFSYENFSILYQRALYQSMQSYAKRIFERLKQSYRSYSGEIKQKAKFIVDSEPDIIKIYQAMLRKKISSVKTRIHGDYHLGQVLYTGSGFVIIDFEGEPARPISERRLKRSPIKDVAGMIRSFHYAAYSAVLRHPFSEIDKYEELANLWFYFVTGKFLEAYLETAKDAIFVPKDPGELETLLRLFLLEKAIYELGYEMNNRPDWVIIPLKAIQQIVTNRLF